MPIAPAVKTAIVEAYYPEALKEADNTRTRAQNGYAIAGAVAAAIVAAGVFGNLDEETSTVQILGFCALVLWLVSALLFLWAVAGRITPSGAASAEDADAFVAAVIARVQTQKDALEERLSWALRLTVTAVAVTVLTLGLALSSEAEPTAKEGVFSLTPAGTAAVGTLCGGTPKMLAGKTDPAALSAPFVKVTVTAGCGEPSRVIRLAKGTFSGFAAS